MEKNYHSPIDPQQWITQVEKKRSSNHLPLLQISLHLYENNAVSSFLQKGLGIADILLTLGLDNEALAAALAYPAFQMSEVHFGAISDYFDESVSKLLHDALQMQSLRKLQHVERRSSHQVENLRKMLLAMITDARAVLIILAERLWQLHRAKLSPLAEQQQLSQETLDIYVPLANRLGIWQIKWEIEDLCFRYLQPDIYKKIAAALAERRQEREAYVERMSTLLVQTLKQAHITQYQVSGRVKHIYSIYSKMVRKQSDFSEIYDITALRVLVPNVDDCYAVLSVLQNNWQQIPKEFDDYIAHPKPNGYRSIHTVIFGPDNHFVEVQIRTYQMHHESELGVAAHWRYKEGVLETSNYEAKIALLREIMAWQKEVMHTAEVKAKQPIQDLFADRVYVFTPTGDIIDLPQGATPLDFAYRVHSEVGHRCRGAKINGHIVPFTYLLQTGERVEILTSKQPNPSRDWINPHLGYLKTAHARAKVQHWFKVQDSLAGHALLEKKVKSPPMEAATPRVIPTHSASQKPSEHIQILGVNNLLTRIASCCKPVPGDLIIGYITQGRGVSIHRQNCNNILHEKALHQHRLIEVDWG